MNIRFGLAVVVLAFHNMNAYPASIANQSDELDVRPFRELASGDPWVRQTTPDEIAVANDGNPVTQIWESSTWKSSNGNLWHTPWQLPVAMQLKGDSPLTIVIPSFQHSRTSGFLINAERAGNDFYFDAFGLFGAVRSADFRWPEDAQKENLQIIDPLPAGDYTVTARFFSLTALDPSVIDFASFERDPLNYDLPFGAVLSIDIRRGFFEVVPEPTTTAQLILFGLILSTLAIAFQRSRT